MCHQTELGAHSLLAAGTGPGQQHQHVLMSGSHTDPKGSGAALCATKQRGCGPIPTAPLAQLLRGLKATTVFPILSPLGRLSVADLQAHPPPRDKGRQSGTEVRPSSHAKALSGHRVSVPPNRTAPRLQHAYPCPRGLYPTARRPHPGTGPTRRPSPPHRPPGVALRRTAPLSMVPPALPFPAAPGTPPPSGAGGEEEAVGRAEGGALCCGYHRDALGRTCRWEWGQ